MRDAALASGGDPTEWMTEKQTVALDIEQLRRDTPGVAYVAHFNNAGAALPPEPVLRAVVDHLQAEARIGGYEAASAAQGAVDATYVAVAELLGCQTDEIALVDCATRAWEAAFHSLPLRAGDRILTGQAEYASNVLSYLHAQRRRGVRVEVIPDDDHGQFDVAELERRIGPDVGLVALTHVPTNGGLVNPAAAVGAVTRAAGVPFLLDACQSAGQIPLDVRELKCDMLSATGRKYLRGPRGTGFLYVRRDLAERLEPATLDLHSATWTGRSDYRLAAGARRFETWEAAVANRIGLGVAVRYALDTGIDAISLRTAGLAAKLRTALRELPAVTVRDKGQQLCGIVTFTTVHENAAMLSARLRQQGINTSVAVREHTRFDMDERDLNEMVRASVHCYNSDEEVARLVAAVAGGP
jgi:cysteine desulfurase / selenocysteine lyase